MELRNAEKVTEEEIIAPYNALRRRTLIRTCHGNNDTLFLSRYLPSLLELIGQVQQQQQQQLRLAGSTDETKLDSEPQTDCSPLNPPNEVVVLEQQTEDCEETGEIVYVPPREALASLEFIQERLKSMQPKADKFRIKMGETDPITNAPRYGVKAMGRIRSLLDTLDAVSIAMEIVFDENSDSLVSILRQEVQSEQEANNIAQLSASAQAIALANARKEEEARAQAEKVRLETEARITKRKEEEELARRAEIARRERMETERREEEATREADRAFVASIRVGVDGVQRQLIRLRETCDSRANRDEHKNALLALHTMFRQIVSHPEEEKFRKIRRDHPNFVNDIGRHPGGNELLIAAGFTLETIDGIPCLVSKEPDLEHDMESWSDWFYLLKKSLELIDIEICHSKQKKPK